MDSLTYVFSGQVIEKIFWPVPLYSRKLHMRVRLESTSCVTSLMILALSFGDRVVNHFARRWMEEDVVSTSLRSVRWVTTGGRSYKNIQLCPAWTIE